MARAFRAASLQTLVRAGIGRLWATPDRIRSVDDAVRQWTTLQMIAEDRADAEAHARHATEQVRARSPHKIICDAPVHLFSFASRIRL